MIEVIDWGQKDKKSWNDANWFQSYVVSFINKPYGTKCITNTKLKFFSSFFQPV